MVIKKIKVDIEIKDNKNIKINFLSITDLLNIFGSIFKNLKEVKNPINRIIKPKTVEWIVPAKINRKAKIK